uniref:Uncharacterized protein n=1 Tax=Bosea sp. NBC_00436 TaxID=2969620 RepID=A0A9E8CLY6_9HYPH
MPFAVLLKSYATLTLRGTSNRSMIVLRHVSLLLLIPLTFCPSLAGARGGGHIGGGFGGGYGRHGLHIHGERRANRSDISTYAAVEMTSATDAAATLAMTTKLIESLSAFNGRLVSQDNDPSALDGVPPAAFFLIAFDTSQEADGWRISQPFKDFEVDAQKAGVRIFTVNALPATQRSERRNAARDAEERAYQKLIENGNNTLKQLHDICRGC